MKRKPTQSERLMRALLRGAKVDRYYALNKLRIAHPGARVGEFREAFFRETWFTGLYVPAFQTVKADGHSFYYIYPRDRKIVRSWWEGRKK